MDLIRHALRSTLDLLWIAAAQGKPREDKTRQEVELISRLSGLSGKCVFVFNYNWNASLMTFSQQLDCQHTQLGLWKEYIYHWKCFYVLNPLAMLNSGIWILLCVTSKWSWVHSCSGSNDDSMEPVRQSLRPS